MEKLRDRLFVGLTGVILLLCIAHFALATLLPNYQLDNLSFLEGRILFQIPEPTAETVFSGEFQEACEQAVADAIPFRNDVLLANAAIQRFGITSANVLFGFEAYPSFFGTTRIILPEQRAIMNLPHKNTERRQKLENEAVDILNELIERHPQVDRWVMAIPGGAEDMPASPLHGSVNNNETYQMVLEHISSRLDSRCQIVDLEIAPGEDVYQYYFLTDHHWQVDGALVAYERIAEVLGLDPLPPMEIRTVSMDRFVGSRARYALFDEYDDTVRDVEFDYGDLDIRADGKQVEPSFLGGCIYRGESELFRGIQFDNLYAAVFHNDYGLIEIINENAPGGTLLIIGDSFSNNFERFFTQGYRTVYVIDPRKYEGSIDTFLTEHDVDDVLFCLCSDVMRNIPTMDSFVMQE